MKQTVSLDALNYEAGVLMALGYYRDDEAIKDCASGILVGIGTENMD